MIAWLGLTPPLTPMNTATLCGVTPQELMVLRMVKSPDVMSLCFNQKILDALVRKNLIIVDNLAHKTTITARGLETLRMFTRQHA